MLRSALRVLHNFGLISPVGTHGRCVLDRNPLRVGFHDRSGTRTHRLCVPTQWLVVSDKEAAPPERYALAGPLRG